MWNSVAPFGLSFLGLTKDVNDMHSKVDNKHVVILNVHNGGHYVLAVGLNGNNFVVHDPYY